MIYRMGCEITFTYFNSYNSNVDTFFLFSTLWIPEQQEIFRVKWGKSTTLVELSMFTEKL